MKKTIVIVENNQIIASVYRSKLQVEGFNVEVATGGQTGLESKFELHLHYALIGGNDIIVKPFHYSEVIVKALPVLFKSRTKDPVLFRNAKA